MTSVYKTSRGTQIDIDRLKLLNETTIAVGNAGVNARGDMVQGNKIIKSREEMMQEAYNISGNNIAKNHKIKESASDLESDIVAPVMNNSPTLYDSMTNPGIVTQTLEQPSLPAEPRGGLASAVNRSQDIAKVLEEQRKRI